MRIEGYSSRLACVCVCMYVCVCLSAHAILAVRVIKSVNERYRRVKRQIYDNIIIAFFLKLSYLKVRASFTHFGRGGHL